MNTSWYFSGFVAATFIFAIAVSGETKPLMPPQDFDYHNSTNTDQALWLIEYGRAVEHELGPSFAQNKLEFKFASYTTSIRAVNFELQTQEESAVETGAQKSKEYRDSVRKLESEFQRTICTNKDMKAHLISDSKLMFRFIANVQSSRPIEFSTAACEDLKKTATGLQLFSR